MKVGTRTLAWGILGLACAAWGQQPHDTGTSSRPLRLEELRELCQGRRNKAAALPASQEVAVACQDVRLEWTVDGHDSVPLPSQRWVRASASFPKYKTEAVQREYVVPSKAGACPVFKQIRKTTLIEARVSCSEILSIPPGEDLADFCQPRLEQAIAAQELGGPRLSQAEPTGAIYATCGVLGAGGQAR